MSTMDPPYGAIVTIPQGRGVVRFKGPTSFMSTGKWVGIELYEKNGKNDGSVDGISYFNCELGYGVFVRPSQIRSIHGSELDAGPSVSYRGAFLSFLSLIQSFGYYPEAASTSSHRSSDRSSTFTKYRWTFTRQFN